MAEQDQKQDSLVQERQNLRLQLDKNPLTVEIVRNALGPTPPAYIYSKDTVAAFIGMPQRVLAEWETQGVVRPLKIRNTDHREIYLYPLTEVLRAICAWGIWTGEEQKHGKDVYEIRDLRNDVGQQGWLERNMDVILKALDTKADDAP
jgi:hypothetical protein